MRPATLQIADLNNDGRNDYAIGSRFYFSTHLQQPDGSFSVSQMFVTGAVSYIAVGDLNNDGLADVAFPFDWSAESLWGDSLRIMFQSQEGLLVEGKSYYLGFEGSVPTIGDLNNDGINDIVVSATNTFGVNDSMKVFYQRGPGDFDSSVAYPAKSYTGVDRAVEIGDFNGDGLNDVVASDSPDARGVSVYLQQPDGSLAYSDTYFTPWGMGDISVGDFNNDGKTDFVAALAANMPDATLFWFFQEQDAGILESPAVVPAYHIPESIDSGDLDGDGKTDLVVAHGGWETITIYRQSMNGQFDVSTLWYPYATHIYHRGMDIGDVNNDGRNDIVLIDWYWGIITFINETPIVSVDRKDVVPSSYQLFQNYPNPFNPSTRIEFDVPVQSHVRVTVYNLVGQLVRTVADGTYGAGNHGIVWNADLNSGVYFARIDASPLDGSKKHFQQTVKMILLK